MCVDADNSGKTRTSGHNLLSRALDRNKHYRACGKQIGAILEKEIEGRIGRGDDHIDLLICILVAQVVVQ